MADNERARDPATVVHRDQRVRVTMEYPISRWRILIDGLTAEELSATPNEAMLVLRDDLREQLAVYLGVW